MTDPREPAGAFPTTPDIAALLEVEKKIPAMPDDLRASAFARARASLAEPVATAAEGSRRLPVWPRAAAALVFLAAAAGVAALQWRREPPAPSPEKPVPAVVVPLAPRSIAPPVPQPAVGVPGTSRPSRGARTRAALQESPDELPLLREAREAVSRRLFAEAIARLVEHEARFPSSRFAEERAALRVRSLSGLGRAAEARRAAEAFRTRFPDSVLLPRMNEAVQSQP